VTLPTPPSTRRLVLAQGAAVLGAAGIGLGLPALARAQSQRVRVGLMLPYTGTFAQLGNAIENGFRMALDEKGGKLGGRDVEFFKVDDESDPAKGVENANRLVQRDRVDVLGRTHAATRAMCAPNVFRTSFTNSQPTLALGKPMVERNHKRAVWITWKYAAGDEAFEGFKDGYTQAGGTIIKELGLPFPNVEFQALLTEIASLRPDAVACFFAGGGAAKFIRDYAAAGLKDRIPLYGSGFLTEGVLDAAGPAAEGIITTMHYSDSLDTPRNKQFRLNYAKTFRLQPDVYAVQGYDTGLLLSAGAAAVKGDLNNKQALYQALRSTAVDSPRGKWTMSKAQNPVQDIYLRRVENKENKVIGIAAKALADSGAGCRLA
jgi:branched-chain amino acid transport system substrate-binding protein